MLDHFRSQIALELLWRATWQSAALAIIVVAVMLVARKQIAPAWRVVLWALPLCRLALLVLPPSNMSLFNLVEQNALATIVISNQMPPTIPKSDLRAPTNEFNLPLPESTPDTPQAPLQPNPSQPNPSQPKPSQPKPSQQVAPESLFDRAEATTADVGILFDIGTVNPATRTSAPTKFRILFWFWIVGCLCSIVHYLVNRLRLTRVLSHATQLDRDDIRAHISSRRKSLGIRRQIKCLLIDDEVGPASAGLLQPKILIPSELLGELNSCQLCSIDKPIHSYVTWTDEKGNFEFFVGDGTYAGRDSGRNTVKKFVVSGEESIEMNLEIPPSTSRVTVPLANTVVAAQLEQSECHSGLALVS